MHAGSACFCEEALQRSGLEVGFVRGIGGLHVNGLERSNITMRHANSYSGENFSDKYKF